MMSDMTEESPSDLHNHDALHCGDACAHHFTHDGGEDRWLLDHRLVPEIPATEKLLALVHNAVVRARKIAVPANATKEDIYRPEVMKTIEAELDALSPQLREINTKIHGMCPWLLQLESQL